MIERFKSMPAERRQRALERMPAEQREKIEKEL
jgi:Mg/Co/Ni transporter MgtE